MQMSKGPFDVIHLPVSRETSAAADAFSSDRAAPASDVHRQPGHPGSRR